MRKCIWRRSFAVGCAAFMLMTAPSMAVLADEVQEKNIVSVQDPELKDGAEAVSAVIEDPGTENAGTVEDAVLSAQDNTTEEEEFGELQVIEETGQEEESVGASYTVGDGVTADYDPRSGAVTFYSNGGTLWQDWISRAGLDADDIESISVADTSGTVFLPADSRTLFANCRFLLSFDAGGFDTSNVTDMSYMFYGCSGLSTLDLRSFDTSNVTTMWSMFNACSNLTDLYLGSFDTTNVTSMEGMFTYCRKLKTLDLGNFNTSSVTVMRHMFSHCDKLTTLNISSFDTYQVTTMQEMFRECGSLESLDLGSFDTSNVTNMYFMFANCTSLTDLDLGNFSTSNVTDMSGLVSRCSGLKTLDVSGFDTTGVTAMSVIFTGCSGLTFLDLGSFDTSRQLSISTMLLDCSGLKILVTPRNNTNTAELPVTMYDSSGNSYTSLPTGNPEGMVIAVTPELAGAYESGNYNPDPYAAIVAGASLTLEGQIGVNIKLILPDAITSDPDAYAVMDFTGEEEVSVTTPVSEAVQVDGRYIFTCPVAVKEVNDPVSIQVYHGDDTQAVLVKGENSRIPLEGNFFSYAVSDYIAAKRDEQTPIGELTRSLDALSAAARIYFGYEAEGAVIEADLSEVTADVLQGYQMNLSPQAAEGIRISGANLSLESETGINVKFSKTGSAFNVDSYIFTVDGQEVTPSGVSAGNCQISIENIPAKDLDKMYTVTVADGAGNEQAISYGALSYAYSKLSKSSSGEGIVNLSKCLYLYSQAANAYFDN